VANQIFALCGRERDSIDVVPLPPQNPARSNLPDPARQARPCRVEANRCAVRACFLRVEVRRQFFQRGKFLQQLAKRDGGAEALLYGCLPASGTTNQSQLKKVAETLAREKSTPDNA